MFLLAGLILKFLKPEWTHLVGRYRGLLGNPNAMGIFSGLVLILLFVVDYLKIFKWTKIQRIIYFAIPITTMLLSKSRSAIMTILVFYVFKRLLKINPFLSFILFLILTFSYNLILTNLPFIVLYFGWEDYFRVDTLAEGSGRYVAWEYAWEYIKENGIWTGGGFTFDVSLFSRESITLSRLGHQGNVHNSFLTFWLNTGVIGLFFFIVGIVRLVLKGLRKSKIILPVIYACLFSAMWESWLTASLNPFTICFILIFCLILYYEPQKLQIED